MTKMTLLVVGNCEQCVSVARCSVLEVRVTESLGRPIIKSVHATALPGLPVALAMV